MRAFVTALDIRLKSCVMRSAVIFGLALILIMSAEKRFAVGLQQDDDWKYVGTSKEGVRLYYSSDRTTEREGFFQAWFKWIYPDSDKQIDYNVELDEFNCRKGTYRMLQGALYRRDGRVQRSNKPSEWEHPLPGSLAEMEFRLMCRSKLPRR